MLGWPGHELTWRGNIPALGARQSAVRDIYRAGANDEGRSKALEFGVTHVYLGREERAQFGDDVAARFAGWPTVFEAGASRIVAVPAESR